MLYIKNIAQELNDVLLEENNTMQIFNKVLVGFELVNSDFDALTFVKKSDFLKLYEKINKKENTEAEKNMLLLLNRETEITAKTVIDRQLLIKMIKDLIENEELSEGKRRRLVIRFAKQIIRTSSDEKYAKEEKIVLRCRGLKENHIDDFIKEYNDETEALKDIDEILQKARNSEQYVVYDEKALKYIRPLLREAITSGVVEQCINYRIIQNADFTETNIEQALNESYYRIEDTEDNFDENEWRQDDLSDDFDEENIFFKKA